jgi:hypothetical protein
MTVTDAFTLSGLPTIWETMGVSRFSDEPTVTVTLVPAAGGLVGSHPPLAVGLTVTLKLLLALPASDRARYLMLFGSAQLPPFGVCSDGWICA